ncbi:MAG: DUF5412 family protein [Aminipila sp.]
MKNIIFIIILTVVLVTGCSGDSNNEIIEKIQSPDGEYIAYVFIRDMGATTQKSYQLSILKKGDALGNKKGNIFISYSNFEVEWNNEKELLVKDTNCEEIFKEKTKYKEIDIKYSSDSQ